MSRDIGLSALSLEHGAIPPAVAADPHDDEVREIALRAADLSDHALKALRVMVDSARAMERVSPGY